MTEEQKRIAAQSVIYLAGCAVKGETPDPGKITNIDDIFAVTSEHKIAAAVAIALERAGLQDARTTGAIAYALKKRLLFEQEYARIKAGLEAAGIWYMPLKGAVLQSFYPLPGMREFADYDILIDKERSGDVKNIMESLGFTTESYNSTHHDVYIKPPVLNFEIHTALFEPEIENTAIYEYYQDVQKRLTGASFEKQFTPEDFYLYMLSHEYKHYQNKGTGLRSLLDTYVFLKKQSLDWDYIKEETEKLGLSDFEKANRSLACHLFDEEELTDAEQKMLGYIISSGAFGTIEHRVENQITKKGSRRRYFLSRLTLPYDIMLQCYPILKKCPLLYPFCWTHRIVRAFFTNRKIFMAQVRGALGLK